MHRRSADCGLKSTTRSLRRFTRPSRRVRQDLPPTVTLLGFCGAPWTLATYMIAGCGTADQLPARLFAYRHPDAFRETDRDAGRSVGELSDSTASRLASRRCRFSTLGREFCRPANFETGVFEPVARIVAKVRSSAPRRQDHRLSARRRHGAWTRIVDAVAVDAIGLDWMIELDFARDRDSAANGRFRAISIRWRCWPEAQRSIGRSMRFWRLSRTGRLSSISAMAFCRRRRLRMSSG